MSLLSPSCSEQPPAPMLAAYIRTTQCLIIALAVIGRFSSVHGSSGDAPVASDQLITIDLPIVDQHYDASRLLARGRTGNANSAPRWYPWNLQARLGLMLLKRQGHLKDFEIYPDKLRLTFFSNALEPLARQLFSPRLLNLDQVNGQPRIAVYVHGLEGCPSTFDQLANALQGDGWFPLHMDYPNDGPVEPPADFLREQLVKINQAFPRSRLVVIAHSLGGLIAWKALSEAGVVGVSDFWALGVPFRGSNLASYQAELELIDVLLKALRGDYTALNVISDGDGEAVEALLPESALRGAILSVPLPESTNLHVVAGNRGPFGADERERLTGMLEQWIEKRKPADSLADDLRAIVASPEITAGEGDGAVTIESATAVQHWTSQREFDKSHIGLVQVDGPDDELLHWIRDQLNTEQATN